MTQVKSMRNLVSTAIEYHNHKSHFNWKGAMIFRRIENTTIKLDGDNVSFVHQSTDSVLFLANYHNSFTMFNSNVDWEKISQLSICRILQRERSLSANGWNFFTSIWMLWW